MMKTGKSILGPNNEEFTVGDFLGRGNFGEVYRAVGNQSSRQVAVKFLPVQEIENETDRTALLNEAELATKINHLNVVRALFFSKADENGEPFLMTEFVDGGTLASTIKKHKAEASLIDLNDARKMMLGIALGAQAINQQIIHRDIKPDNILGSGPTLKIGDFGIGKIINQMTRTHTFKGGQHNCYMAPEGWENDTNTFKLDVYSVGLVFYEILTLKHPLEPSVKDLADWKCWREAHLYGACPDVRSLRSGVSQQIGQLLSRMVSKRPQDRPEWKEIIQIIKTVYEEKQDSSPNPIVEAALKKMKEKESDKLEMAKKEEVKNNQEGLYHQSCKQLAKLFDEEIEKLNQGFQARKISIGKSGELNRIYKLPTDDRVLLWFFPRGNSSISLLNGDLIGGAWLGVDGGMSGNLLLIKEGSDDLYGKWHGCFIDIHALVNRGQLIGHCGIDSDTVMPFGFKRGDDFYSEIPHARGGMHVFTYEIMSDISKFFSKILHAAVS